MIKKIILFLFATLMVLGFDIKVEAVNIDDYAHCVYNFYLEGQDDAKTKLYATNYYSDSKDFYLFYNTETKMVEFYNSVNHENTYHINLGPSTQGIEQGSIYSSIIKQNDIYDSNTNKAVCNPLFIKADTAGSYYICSAGFCTENEGFTSGVAMSSSVVKKVDGIAIDPTLSIQMCSEEIISKIWSSIENSTELKNTRDYYLSQKSKITNYDYAGSYNTKISTGMSSSDALNAVKAEIIKLATDFYPTETAYNKYITSALSQNGYYKDYNCQYDAEDDNPVKFKQYYNFVPFTHSTLVSAATAFYKKSIAAMKTAGTLTSEEYNNAVIGIENDKASANDKYVKEAAARTTKYVEKMKNHNLGNVDSSCEALLTPKAVEFLNKIFNYFKIIAPILVIILGTVDFSQAVLSSDKDTLSKATNKFIRRCIAAIALFFIPLLLTILLTAFGSTNPLCGVSMIILNL